MNHGSPPQPHFILPRGRHARCELTRQAWFRWLRNVDKTGEILVVQSEEFTIRAATAERLKRGEVRIYVETRPCRAPPELPVASGIRPTSPRESADADHPDDNQRGHSGCDRPRQTPPCCGRSPPGRNRSF